MNEKKVLKESKCNIVAIGYLSQESTGVHCVILLPFCVIRFFFFSKKKMIGAAFSECLLPDRG